mmetsp:Transcript_59596/g.116928  ORF Transcript_59596/g.116928 Transcript_59596/m.116928 type:complete len:114 (-) Transcript_59596:194-535(-)
MKNKRRGCFLGPMFCESPLKFHRTSTWSECTTACSEVGERSSATDVDSQEEDSPEALASKLESVAIDRAKPRFPRTYRDYAASPPLLSLRFLCSLLGLRVNFELTTRVCFRCP